EIRATLPELPAAKRQRYASELGLSPEDAAVLTESSAVAAFFEDVQRRGIPAKMAANWVMGEVLRVMNRDALEAPPLSAERLSELLACVNDGTVSVTAAKQVFEDMLATGKPAPELIREKGLRQVSDAGALA